MEIIPPYLRNINKTEKVHTNGMDEDEYEKPKLEEEDNFSTINVPYEHQNQNSKYLNYIRRLEQILDIISGKRREV